MTFPFRKSLTLGGISPAQFVGSNFGVHAAGSDSRPLPGGAKAGHTAVLVTEFDATGAGTTVTSSTGWLKSTRAWWYAATIHIKRLDATDISVGSIGFSGLQSGSMSGLCVWSATGAQVRTDQGNSASQGATLALAGFTKSQRCRGLAAIVINRDPDVAIVKPTGWNDRGGIGPSANSFSWRAADLLLPHTYVNGAPVTFSGLQGAADYGQHGYLIELT